MGKLNDKLKDVVRNWLNIVPAPGDTITIQETNTFEGNCFRNLLWYRGDASELHQYYTQTDDMMGNAKFWASDTTNDLKMRKIHTGLPAMIVDMLADIIVDSFNKITVEKTVLSVTEETKNNICRNYEFDYQTLEEVQQGIALELNRYNTNDTAPIKIQDEHGNEYKFDDFGPTDTWEEGTPEKINYFEHNGQAFRVLFAPANYVTWTNDESFVAQGFDWSNIFVKVGIFITPVKITANLGTENFVYGEYQANKGQFAHCFSLSVSDLDYYDSVVDLIDFEIKKGEETLTTGANVGLNNEHKGYFYLNVADNILDIGTYTVDLNKKYPKAIIIEYADNVQQQSVVIEKADLKLTTESYVGETGNNGCDVTISETGDITAKYLVYYEGIDPFYKGYLSDADNLSEFVYAELETIDNVQGSNDTVELSDINITTELIDDRVWVVINAHVDSMTGEYGNYDFFNITATSGDEFFNGLDSDCYLNITRSES